jgi:nitroreductase
MISFGLVQLVLSQIPNFGELWWLSYLAAAMSFMYSTTALGLGIGKIAGRGHQLYLLSLTLL